jgi:UDP-GlcNAc:undecaprenyl-phosphate GlcNAc-1-phosphate transferase
MLKYAILFLAGLVLSLLLTPLVRSLAIRLGAIDYPGGRKTHPKPTARLGGFAIFISFYLILLVTLQFDFFHYPPGILQMIKFWWIFVASAIVLSLGAVCRLSHPWRIGSFLHLLQKYQLCSSPYGYRRCLLYRY